VECGEEEGEGEEEVDLPHRLVVVIVIINKPIRDGGRIQQG
jgi:hypothetical protein